MRKFMMAIAFMLLLPCGVSMAMSAADKKDDKKGGKGNDDEKHEPVLIIIWEQAWSPIFRAIPLQNAINTGLASENK